MGLEKAIEHKKEHRKKYYKAKAIDSSCRNHGSCPYCKENRLYKSKRLKEKEKYDIKEHNKYIQYK